MSPTAKEERVGPLSKCDQPSLEQSGKSNAEYGYRTSMTVLLKNVALQHAEEREQKDNESARSLSTQSSMENTPQPTESEQNNAMQSEVDSLAASDVSTLEKSPTTSDSAPQKDDKNTGDPTNASSDTPSVTPQVNPREILPQDHPQPSSQVPTSLSADQMQRGVMPSSRNFDTKQNLGDDAKTIFGSESATDQVQGQLQGSIDSGSQQSKATHVAAGRKGGTDEPSKKQQQEQSNQQTQQSASSTTRPIGDPRNEEQLQSKQPVGGEAGAEGVAAVENAKGGKAARGQDGQGKNSHGSEDRPAPCGPGEHVRLLDKWE